MVGQSADKDKKSMSTPKILITGATGFIGGHILQKLLSAGYECIALSRKPDTVLSSLLAPGNIVIGPLEESINKSALFENIVAVVHCAARVHQMRETVSDPIAEYRRVNRDLTVSLARAALKAGVPKFIFLSTIKVMGDQGLAGKIFDETDIPAPTDPYGQSKWEAEQGLQAIFRSQTDCRCIILRLPMVYGEGNKGNMLGLLKAASKKLPLPLKAVSAKRSMVYCGNITGAVLRILTFSPEDIGPAETFFLTDVVDHSSAELYSAIYCAMNDGGTGLLYVPPILFKTAALFSKKARRIVSRLFEEYRFSSERFQKAYDWQPSFTLKRGTQQLVELYRKHEKSLIE
jgi:nucleoside-diphosphate-sugar epimerase